MRHIEGVFCSAMRQTSTGRVLAGEWEAVRQASLQRWMLFGNETDLFTTLSAGMPPLTGADQGDVRQ